MAKNKPMTRTRNKHGVESVPFIYKGKARKYEL